MKHEKPAPPTPKTAPQPTIFVPPHQLPIKLLANAIMKTFHAFFSTVCQAPDTVNLTHPDSFFLPSPWRTQGDARASAIAALLPTTLVLSGSLPGKFVWP
jgi:hypothetical protein